MMDFKVDFIGIGVEKAATYWIADCLREHPEVCFSDKKELAFFNEFDQHFLTVRNPRYSRGIEWYKKHFKDCEKGKIKGEFTPTYLYSEETAKRIKKYFPEAKLILCLRNPVDRAFSQYLHDRSTGVIKNISFEEALAASDSYIEKGKYYKYLRLYLKHFKKNQILVLLTDDIKKDPKKTIKKIYKFVGIKKADFIPPSLLAKPNGASSATSSKLNYVLLQSEYFLMRNNLDFLHQMIEDSGVRRKLFLFSYYVNRKPLEDYPKMKDATRKKLIGKLRGDTGKLKKLIKRSLREWK
jgi:hypothetical protein